MVAGGRDKQGGRSKNVSKHPGSIPKVFLNEGFVSTRGSGHVTERGGERVTGGDPIPDIQTSGFDDLRART